MSSFLRKFYIAGLRRFNITPRYRAIVVEDIPDSFEDGYIYLIGETNLFWQAALECPCGCSQIIQLALTQDSHPRWKYNGTFPNPTLAPSVQRSKGCRSHFFLQHGRIIWCD